METKEIIDKIEKSYLVLSHEEAGDFLRFYITAEQISSLFPVNEEEEVRLFKFAKIIWKCSELYHEKE